MKNNLKIGFIGFGRMGSVLGKALIANKAVTPAQVVVYDHHADKNKYPHGIQFLKSEQEVVNAAQIVFLCMRPLGVEPVANKLIATKGRVFISVAAGVSLTTLQKYFRESVVRIIPGYTQRIGEGPILYCINKKVSPRTMKITLDLLRRIGEPEEIPESLLEVASDLTSCAPAFWAFLLNTFIEEAAWRGMNYETAKRISAQALLASARILLQEPNLPDVIDCVATPGGITREGINVLEREFPRTVREVFDATERKYRELRRTLG